MMAHRVELLEEDLKNGNYEKIPLGYFDRYLTIPISTLYCVQLWRRPVSAIVVPVCVRMCS